ncbi:ABC transporter permease [Megasphaera vaginalis (ex Srinivasan et al. 2021)]|uniref:ABC-2 family transporter protein n=1 Tax=Megasphaera vaginalis (ex Srinivasan et al. 2021) TaxID=1111454 RepID=U7UVI2_9FIRM|nr:ABC transporter permease [Megasphaera vaginalis (ex Srinivasan et al. 2021)]ERT62478.1 ABC-2 family transporter protein [Megasphaera vaginalis (ex Srinivasan et al. 2021)]
MKIKSILCDAWHDLWRGRYPLALLILLVPLGFTVLFGFVYMENSVNHIPLAIYDRDQSNASRKLIQMYSDSERFTVVDQIVSEGQLEEAIHQYDALVTLEIPKGFSKDIRSGKQSNVLVTVNSVNNMFSNAALASAQEINRSYTVAVGQKLVEGLNVVPDVALNMVYPVHFGIRILNNPTNGYTQFMLSGLLLNGMQVSMMGIVGPILIGEILRRRYNRQTKAVCIVLANWLPIWALGMVSFFISFLVAVYGFHVPMRGNWLEVGVLIASFLTFLISVLMLFSACASNRGSSMQLPMVYIMPGLLYSGLSWPSFDMNTVAHVLSLTMPMAYVGDTLRDLSLNGMSPMLWSNCAYMIGIGIVCLVLATLIFQKRRMRAFDAEQKESVS